MKGNSTMRAAWLENSGCDPCLIEIREVQQPELADGEALVEVRLAGVCSTDLELLRGYYPFAGVPGHEFVGRVVACPTDAGWVGQRVVGEINISCGKCVYCQSGMPTHCANRKALGIHDHWGAFAERLSIPVSNLHAVPDNVSDEAAVFTEPLAAALEIQAQVQFRPGQPVLVVGAGRLGQLVAQTLGLIGCKLSVVARHARQRRLLEARHIHWITQEQVSQGLFEVVVDTTGTPDGFALARQAVMPRGTIVLKSTYKGDLTVNFSSLVVDEITLIGSRCGPFEPALQLLASGQVDPRPLVEATYALEQAAQAIAHAAQPGVLKILIDPKIPAV
jgi:2-desacetyl-2-hydroxyethyl bacteriochlorophyllide A dehydrogenase